MAGVDEPSEKKLPRELWKTLQTRPKKYTPPTPQDPLYHAAFSRGKHFFYRNLVWEDGATVELDPMFISL